MEGNYKLFLGICLLLFGSVSAYGQVGINTTTPLSTLDINGNLSIKTITISGGTNASPVFIEDGVYISLDPRNGTSDHFRIPNPTSCPGRIYVLRNITDFDTAQLSIIGGTSRFFPKNTSTGSFTLSMPPNAVDKSIILVSDGFNWTYFN